MIGLFFIYIFLPLKTDLIATKLINLEILGIFFTGFFCWGWGGLGRSAHKKIAMFKNSYTIMKKRGGEDYYGISLKLI